MEDREIIDLYWQRDEAAIRESAAKYGSYCSTVARGILHSPQDTEECVNDTWFRAWNLMPDQRPQALSAFLGRITRNLALNRIKEKNRIKRGGGEAALALDELAECIPGGSTPEEELEAKELETAIGRFVAGLSVPERNVFVLRYWYLAPIADISDRLSCSQGKIKSILFRSRKKLRVYLQKEGLWQTR